MDLNKIIHERARLMILTFLASTAGGRANFVELREELKLSAGNLSVQLKTLEEAGFTTIEKSFKDNKPLTEITISLEGRKALNDYLETMERLILEVRKNSLVPR